MCFQGGFGDFYFPLSISLGPILLNACEILSLGLEVGAMKLLRWDILTREDSHSHEFKNLLRTLISHFCVLQAY
jgi:hypothetical protein